MCRTYIFSAVFQVLFHDFNLVRSGHRRLAGSFNLCYRYMDDLIVFKNKKFIDYVKDVYSSERNADKGNRLDDQTNYLDLTFIKGNNRLYTNMYDKSDDFSCHMVNLKFWSFIWCLYFAAYQICKVLYIL